MAKLFGIVLILLALWIGAEIYTQGTDRAFGGALSALGIGGDAREAGEGRSLAERTGARAARVHAEADARRERMLAE